LATNRNGGMLRLNASRYDDDDEDDDDDGGGDDDDDDDVPIILSISRGKLKFPLFPIHHY